MTQFKISDEDLISYTNKGLSVKEIGKLKNYKNLFLIRKRLQLLNLKENYKCSVCDTTENLNYQKNKIGKLIKTNICVKCFKNLGKELCEKRIGTPPYAQKDILYKEYILKNRTPYELCDLWKAKIETIKKYLDFFGFEENHRCYNCQSTENLIPRTDKHVFKYQKLCRSCLISGIKETNKQLHNKKLSFITKDLLYDLHINQKLNLVQIRIKLKISLKTCKKLFKKYGIEEVKRCNVCGEEDLSKLFIARKKQSNICYDCFCESGSMRTNCSKMSQDFFWKIYDLLPEDLKSSVMFKELNKEKCVVLSKEGKECLQAKNNAYHLDFYLNCLGIPLVIEFNGDVFHGNPEMFYWFDKPNPFTNDTAEVLWKKDEDKSDYLSSIGYYVIFVWEKDYKKNKNFWINYCLLHINNLYTNVKNGIIN